MKWQGRRGSSNVEDRRGMSTGGKVVGGGIGTLVIVLLVYLLGGDPSSIINQGGSETETSGPIEATEEENQMAQFVSVVLADTEEVWDKLFREAGATYRKPTLVFVPRSGTVGLRLRNCSQRSVLLPRRRESIH